MTATTKTRRVTKPAFDIVALRHDAALAAKSGEQSFTAYARALNALFNCKWYKGTMEPGVNTAITAEKQAFYIELKEAQYSNPSVAWSRIKSYAEAAYLADHPDDPEAVQRSEKKAQQAEAKAAQRAAKKAEGKQPETKTLPAIDSTTPHGRNVETLRGLWLFNRALRSDTCPQDIKSAQMYIAKALEALGVNLNEL